MNQPQQLDRAHLLMQQGRWDLAETELQKVLAAEPQDALAHSLLAHVLLAQERLEPALAECRQAIACDPEHPYGHFVHSLVLNHQDKYAEAEAAAREAISLDPTSPLLYAQLARAQIGQKRWQEAAEATETGLQYDADAVDCQNLRAVALRHLGRHDDAYASIEEALRIDPDDDRTHANLGWSRVHSGQASEAAEHFREALRLNPDNAWARTGIVEALKARNPIYRWFLRYVLWMSSFTARTQLLMFVGIIVLLQILSRMPPDKGLQQAGTVLAICYVIFVGFSWLASPIFELLLLLDPFGRMVLTDEQKADAGWLAGALVLVAVLASGPLITGFPSRMHALPYLLLMLAVGVVLSVPRGPRRRVPGVIAGLLFAAAVAHWARFYVLFDPEQLMPKAELFRFIRSQKQLQNVFLWGAILLSWMRALGR